MLALLDPAWLRRPLPLLPGPVWSRQKDQSRWGVSHAREGCGTDPSSQDRAAPGGFSVGDGGDGGNEMLVHVTEKPRGLVSGVAGSRASVFVTGAQGLLTLPAFSCPHRTLSTLCSSPEARKLFPSDSGARLGIGLAPPHATANPVLRPALKGRDCRPEPHARGG